VLVALAVDLGHEQFADDQVGQGVRDLAVGVEVANTYCFMVDATSAWSMRLLSVFQSIIALRPAVA
jgi:hypothetical protein